jgi:hypothetical protein
LPNFQKAAIAQYFCTGEHDALFRAWPGGTFTARVRQGDLALRGALISLVKSRAGHTTVPKELVKFGRGVIYAHKGRADGAWALSRSGAAVGAGRARRSIVFLTPATIEPVLNPGSPADFGKLIADETEKWAKVIRAADIKL